MASSVIHLCVANEVNKILKRNKKQILIGSIAPDISKLIGETKIKSHFLDNHENDIPNLNLFLDKYKDRLNDDFVLGYYIHLYTDYLWFKYFITNFIDKEYIYKLDGSKIKLSNEILTEYMYNDYTNLNIKLIEKYNLDLKIFYENIPLFNNIIDEIPMDKLKILIDNAGVIIENTKQRKIYIFNINMIEKFINDCSKKIISDLENK